MTNLAPHRVWAGILATAVVLMLVSSPILKHLRADASRSLMQAQKERAKAEQSLKQLEDDIATAQKLRGQIGEAEAERSLAPIDRLQVAAMLEHQASRAHLSHFTYTLSPEQKTDIDSTSGPQELAASSVTLSADAALDTDVFAFLDRLRQSVPGRLRVQQFSLERIGGGNSPLSATNLRFTATCEWLSNGTMKDLAGAP